MKFHFALFLAMWLGCWLVGCAAETVTAFRGDFPDNRFEYSETVLKKIAAAKAKHQPGQSPELPVVVGIQDATPHKLFAYDLQTSKLLWQRQTKLGSLPQILGDIVLTADKSRLQAYSLESGKPLWNRELDGLTYMGAGRSSNYIVYTQSTDMAAKENHSLVSAVDARSGHLLWQQRTSGRLGRPEALHQLVFLVWDKQNLVTLDLMDGREIARFRFTDDVINGIKADATGVFFGDRTIYKLTAEGYTGTKDSATRIDSPLSNIPTNPPLFPNAFAYHPNLRSAKGHIEVHFRTDASANREIVITDDRFYFIFYRYVFGFDTKANLAFVQLFDNDIVASQSVDGGLLILTDKGLLHRLHNRDGRLLSSTKIGFPVEAASIVAGTWAVPDDNRQNKDDTLRDGLLQVVADSDNRLVLARIFALQQLSALSDENIVKDLLDLYRLKSMPEVIKKSIAEALLAQNSGEEHLLRALYQRYDFLQDTQPPPYSIIIVALIKMRVHRSVPMLIRNLYDFETPIDQLPIIIDGIVKLGDASVVQPLDKFLHLYRSDSSFVGFEDVLVKVAQGLLVHGDDTEKQKLHKMASQETTLGPLALGIRQLLAPQPTGSQATPSLLASQRGGRQLPEMLTQGLINATFSEHIDEIRQCIIEEISRNEKLSQVRIAFIINNNGTAQGFQFTPNTAAFVQCLLPKVNQYRFPRFHRKRQMASYLIAIRSDSMSEKIEMVAASATEPQASKPWWAFYEAKALQYQTLDLPRRKPWWYNQNIIPQKKDTQPKSTTPTSPPSAPKAAPTDKWWLPVE